MMNNMNRRAFMKKAVYLGAGLIAVAGAGVGWKVMKRTFLRSEGTTSSLQQNSVQSGEGPQWFTPAEFATVKVLASIIVPSDGNGPGAEDADVARQLDQHLSDTPRLQAVYRPGLAAIDQLARGQYGQTFANLPVKDQIELFSAIEGAWIAMEKEPVSVMERAFRKGNFLYYYKWLGITPAAAQLSGHIIRDVKEQFYSSQLAWAWLGYEGPPFPLGYFSKPDRCSIPMV